MSYKDGFVIEYVHPDPIEFESTPPLINKDGEVIRETLSKKFRISKKEERKRYRDNKWKREHVPTQYKLTIGDVVFSEEYGKGKVRAFFADKVEVAFKNRKAICYRYPDALMRGLITKSDTPMNL
jgi:hypothetical protein